MTEEQFDEMLMLVDAGMSFDDIGRRYMMPGWLVEMRTQQDEAWLRKCWSDQRKWAEMGRQFREELDRKIEAKKCQKNQ